MFVSFFNSEVFHELKDPKVVSQSNIPAPVTWCGHSWGKPETGGYWVDAYGRRLFYDDKELEGKRLCEGCARAKRTAMSS
jgi:hypothetical protein